jgi:hypothetical protein
LLPIRFRRELFLGCSECAVNDSGRVLLHAGQHVRIKIERDADLGVPEALAGDLGVNARREQVGRVGMAQVVEADPRQVAVLEQPRPFMRETARL